MSDTKAQRPRLINIAAYAAISSALRSLADEDRGDYLTFAYNGSK